MIRSVAGEDAHERRIQSDPSCSRSGPCSSPRAHSSALTGGHAGFCRNLDTGARAAGRRPHAMRKSSVSPRVDAHEDRCARYPRAGGAGRSMRSGRRSPRRVSRR
jgi:hypothetical protein